MKPSDQPSRHSPQDSLSHYVEILNGGDAYLRLLVQGIRQRQGSEFESKDSGARPGLLQETSAKLDRLKRLAGSYERELRTPEGALERAAIAHHERFQLLVETWIGCRRDWKRWAMEQPRLWALVQRTHKETTRVLIPREKQLEFAERYPDKPRATLRNAGSAAARLFLLLAREPSRDRLRRCGRCREWFAARRYDQRSCSARCATALTALEATRRSRERGRKLQLARLRAAIKRTISRKGAPPDWKRRVAQKAEVTQTFVTRAVTSGEIKPPKILASRGRRAR
jgi:hypothetical protein